MSEAAADRRAQLAKILRERTAARAGPLTPAQRRLWFLEQVDAGQPTYHIPTVVRLAGRIDHPALARAVNELVSRHEALRTVVDVAGGEPQQRVIPRLDIEVATITLEPGPAGEADAESDKRIERVMSEEVQHGFDLIRGPLVRATVIRVSANLSFLVLTVHHLVADGWSLIVMLRELNTLYQAFAAGDPSPLADPPLQYLDYARWLERRLSGDSYARQLGFWRRALDGAPPWLDLPADHTRPALPSLRGARHPFELAPPDVDRLRALVKDRDATLFMGLLAALAVLLHRRSGQTDLVIGSPVANRGRVEMEGIVGLCANVLPLRVDLRGDPGFGEIVSRARETVLAALLHQDLPFEHLVKELQSVRALGRNPIFQVLFTLQNLPRGRPPPRAGDGAPARPTTPIVGTGRAQFDLSLSVNEADGALLCSFEYATDLFTANTAAHMADELVQLLRAACARAELPLSRLPFLSAAARARVIAAAGAEAGPARAAHLTIADRARATPDAPALASDAGTVTFAALDAKVAAWAGRLRGHGVVLETPVVVCGERDPSLVIGALAVWRAGGAYVPIDPDLPAARVAALLAQARPVLILSQRALADRWRDAGVRWLALDDPPGADARCEPAPPPPAAAAYIVFTSGTTGGPKGVVVTHGGLANHVRALQALYPLGPDDAVLQLTGIGFDASLLELCAPLAAGARLFVPPPGIQRDPAAIVDAMARHRITAIQATPSQLRLILDEPGLDRCHRLRRVYCGGEAMPVELQRRFVARLDAELLNLYGPTETTIDATSWRCRHEPERRAVPIGAAVPGARALVLDAHLEPTPVGVVGDLYVGGDGVARGYLGDPALTAACFGPDPFGPPGARLYRTGDRARRRNDGAIEFAGRADSQVKVRGHRIELGEIEAGLRRHPAVVNAAAALSAAGDARLVAAVTVRTPVTIEALRNHLTAALPAAVVPVAIRVVDALPHGPTAKIDRHAVAALVDSSLAAPPEPPRTGDEERLAAIWRTVLDVDHVGRNDSFFELGGHSLLATQLVARVRDRFGLELTLRQLFMNPTVAGAAAWLDAARREADERIVPVIGGPPAVAVELDDAPPHVARIAGPFAAAALKAALAALYRRHSILSAAATGFAAETTALGGLILRAHPAVCDRVALALAAAELIRLHALAAAGRPLDDPPRSLTWGDVSAWLEQRGRGDHADAVADWRAALAACGDVAAAPTTAAVSAHPLALSPAVADELRALATAARVRTRSVLVAALALAARPRAGGSVAVATAVPHRDRSELATVIGALGDLVPISSATRGDAIALTLLAAIDAALDLAARNPGLVALVRERTPRFQLHIEPALTSPVLTLDPPHGAEVSVVLRPDGAGLCGAVQARANASAWAADFLSVLDHLLAAPGRTINELIHDPA